MPPIIGPSTTPIPREFCYSVEEEEQFENALSVLTAYSKLDDDAVLAKKACLNQIAKVPFERYDNVIFT